MLLILRSSSTGHNRAKPVRVVRKTPTGVEAGSDNPAVPTAKHPLLGNVGQPRIIVPIANGQAAFSCATSFGLSLAGQPSGESHSRQIWLPYGLE